MKPLAREQLSWGAEAFAIAVETGVRRRWVADFLRVELAMRARHGHGPGTFTIGGRHIRYADPFTLRYVFREVFVQQVYEVGDLPPQPTIVDVGANIGIASLWFQQRHRGCRIVAVEADPSLAPLCRANLVDGRGDVTLHEAAAAGDDGEVELFVGPPDASLVSSTTKDERHTHSVTVPAIRLSRVLPEHVDLLKIDIEGGEWGVVEDLSARNAFDRVERIAMEYHHHVEGGRSDGLPAMLDLLAGHGYTYALRAESDHAGDVSVQRDPAAPQNVMIYAAR